MINRTYSILLAVGLSIVCARSAEAAYTICAVGDVLTTDSGITIPNGPNAGDTEDSWSNANGGISKVIPGILIEVVVGGSTLIEWGDTDGCATFSGSAANATVRFRSATRRGGSNRLILHDDPFDFSQPSATWSFVYANQNLSGGNTYTYTNIGAGIAKWTAFFTANFTLGEWKAQLANTYIYLGMDEACPSGLASAHYGAGGSASNGQITAGRHYLGIANCNPDVLTRRKFTIAHEMGHAIAALYYGMSASAQDGDEPSSTDYGNDLDPARGPTASSCQSSSYTINSKEWNSVTFREGYAHFIAAAAWSDRDDPGTAGAAGTGQEGAFTWFIQSEDLERYSQGSGTNSGGRLENICCVEPGSNCSTSWDSAGTNGDWLRFLWDFWTDTSCANRPTREQMLEIYRETRLNGGLTKGNYFTKSRAAMQSVFGTCLEDAFDTWSAWNGVDHDT